MREHGCRYRSTAEQTEAAVRESRKSMLGGGRTRDRGKSDEGVGRSSSPEKCSYRQLSFGSFCKLSSHSYTFSPSRLQSAFPELGQWPICNAGLRWTCEQARGPVFDSAPRNGLEIGVCISERVVTRTKGKIVEELPRKANSNRLKPIDSLSRVSFSPVHR